LYFPSGSRGKIGRYHPLLIVSLRDDLNKMIRKVMTLAVRSGRRYTKRVQTVLTEEQYVLLKEIAREQGKPVSVLIREAIEEEYLEKVARKRRRAALKSLLSLEAPVADWEEMEAEIAKGAFEVQGQAHGRG